MTTQHPEALRLAEELDDGYPLTGDAISAAAELRTQHARITELEAQLAQRFDAADMATAAAQGFRDGVASLAENAGSEPVAIYHGRCVIDCGAHGHLDMELLKMIPAGSKLYTHPSPPEGMAGWQPIETAPRDGTEILLYAPACVYEGAPVEARITYGKWLEPSDTPRIKYQDGFAPDIEWDEFDAHWVSWDGGFTPEHSPTHWMPLPPAPGPADGESNG